MKKTRNLIIGGVVTVGVLAAIGAITIARYAAKHMEREDIPDDCECDGDCENCPLNDKDVEVEIEVQPADPEAEEVVVPAEAPAEEAPGEEPAAEEA